MMVMTWRVGIGPDGRRALQATWDAEDIPAADELVGTTGPVLRAS